MAPKQVFVATLVVLGTLVGAYMIVRLRDIIVLMVIALIFSSAISPAVRFLNRRLPLSASIGIVYLVLFTVVSGLFAIIVPPLVGQTAALVQSAPGLVASAQDQLASLQGRLPLPGGRLDLDLQSYYERLSRSLPSLAAGVLNVTLGFITGLAGVILILVIAFYWMLERRGVQTASLRMMSGPQRARVRAIIDDIEAKLGAYVRGQLLLGLIVGVLAYVGLRVAGIDFALVLALVAGVSELVPLIGPFIGAIPAVLIALAESPQQALLVAGWYIVVQQLENNLLVPKIMERTVGLSPLTIMFSVLAGGALLGFIGVLLAVPVAAAVQVVLSHTVFASDPQPVRDQPEAVPS